MMKNILSVFVLMLATGCASAPRYVASNGPETGQALVYIYWVPAYTTYELSPSIIIDGKKYQNIRSGGYVYSYLKEGEYKIGLQFGLRQLNTSFRFNGGETYYIKVTSGIRPVGHYNTLANFRIENIGTTTGSQEIVQTSLISELIL